MAANAFDDARHKTQVESVNNSLAQILSACQQIVAQGDGLLTLRAAWIAEVAAGTLDQSTINTLDAMKTDLTPLYQAAKTYRDANQ